MVMTCLLANSLVCQAKTTNVSCRWRYGVFPIVFDGALNTLFKSRYLGSTNRKSSSQAAVSRKGKRAGPYGLTMVDYSVAPPYWPLPRRPPIPKGAMGATQLYLGPALCAVFLVGAVYVYFNQEDDVYEYWKQVERGNVFIDDNDDDEDGDDEWVDE